MRLTILVLCTALLVVFIFGCGGGSGVAVPNPNDAQNQPPVQTEPTPQVPVVQLPVVEPDASPGTDPVALEMIRNTNWDIFGMPKMDPAAIIPEDTAYPNLVIITGVDPGDVVSRNVHLSIVASDNYRINLTALIVDGFALEVVEDAALQYDWDTSGWTDGAHEIGVLVRDMGNNYGYAKAAVTVDNTSDLQGPVIEIASVTSTVEGKTVEMARREPVNINSYRLVASGLAHITIVATDASELKYFVADGAPEYGSWDDWVPLAESATNTLEISVQTNVESITSTRHLIRAEDIHGNVSEIRFYLSGVNRLPVSGTVFDSEYETVGGAEIFVMPGEWNLSDGNIEGNMIRSTTSQADYENRPYWFDDSYIGKFRIYVPVGSSKLLIRSDDRILVTPLFFQPVKNFGGFKLTADQTRLE